jgi:hypothetical protein
MDWTDEGGVFKDDVQKMICEQVLDLLNLFYTHGHSGSSAPYAINLFKRLASFEPIGPLTGVDSEWNEVGDGIFQNNRCGHVFKQADRFDGQAYDIEAIIWWDWYTDKETGVKYKSHFTNRDSAQPITFPYTPERKYMERVES